MSARRDKVADRHNQRENRSRLQFGLLIDPWKFTTPDQGSDFGLDGFCSVFDAMENGSAVRTPLFFGVQLKSHETPLAECHSEVLEVRDLLAWSDPVAASTVIVVWSEAQSEFRARLASEVADELDRLHEHWRSQESVTVHFRVGDVLRRQDESLNQLRRRVAHCHDRVGGVSQLSRYRRSVLLTDIYLGTHSTSQLVTLKSLDADDHWCFHVGPAWDTGDLSPQEVEATRVITAAAVLYETIWLPVHAIGSLLHALQPSQLLAQLRSGKFRFYFSNQQVVLKADRPIGRGTLELITPQEEWVARAKRAVEGMLALHFTTGPIRQAIIDEVMLCLTPLSDHCTAAAFRVAQHDLRDRVVRDLLDLGPDISLTESMCDLRPIGRVAHLNQSLAAAQELKVDVIELEGGLSLIANQKQFSQFGLSRCFPSLDALTQLFHLMGVPDCGFLAGRLGFANALALCDSKAAQDFRDWFWEAAEPYYSRGHRDDALMKSVLGSAYGVAPYPLRFINDMKLRFFQIEDGILRPCARTTSTLAGVASRCDSPRDRLRIQARNSQLARRRLITEAAGHLPAPYSSCICGGGAKFKFCCGR